MEVPLYPRILCLAKENQAGFYLWVTITMINILTNQFGFEIANLTVITNKSVTVIPATKTSLCRPQPVTVFMGLA